jgi:lipoic acid synthetase
MLTVGQYLQPYLPVKRYVPPVEFDQLKAYADEIGFAYTASGPLVAQATMLISKQQVKK